MLRACWPAHTFDFSWKQVKLFLGLRLLLLLRLCERLCFSSRAELFRRDYLQELSIERESDCASICIVVFSYAKKTLYNFCTRKRGFYFELKIHGTS